MCKDNDVKVIECNLRASRTFPFISKTFNLNLIEIAAKVMLNVPVRTAHVHPIDLDIVGCKVPVFSFTRLKNSDPRLGVEMQSTGEVACFGQNQYEAYLTSLIAAGFKLPDKNILVSIGPLNAKVEFLPAVRLLQEMGYQIYATKNTHDFLKQNNVQNCALLYKPMLNREPNSRTLLMQGKIDLVINVPDSMDSGGVTDGFQMRRLAIESGVSLLNDVKTATLFCHALHRKWRRENTGRSFWSIRSWQQAVSDRRSDEM